MESELEGLVKVIRTADEVRADEYQRWARKNLLVSGLKRCPECGGRAKGVIFGAKRRGVWVGCDRTKGCYRHICLHTEGWSFEEVCEEWNRENSWPWSWVKWVKVLCEKRWGKRARWDREREKEKRRKRIEAEMERKRVFGDFRPEKEGLIKRISGKIRGIFVKSAPKRGEKTAKAGKRG